MYLDPVQEDFRVGVGLDVFIPICPNLCTHMGMFDQDPIFEHQDKLG